MIHFLFTGFKSAIIGHIPSYQNKLMLWLSESGFGEKYWVPCYKNAVNGWWRNNFHTKCDNKGPTITLARQAHSDQKASYIFGGFNDHSWNGESCVLSVS